MCHGREEATRQPLARRELLASVATALPALGGCTGTGEPHHVRFESIELVNFGDEPVTVHVVVERGETVVHDDRYSLDAADGAEASGVTLQKQWMRSAGRYDVAVTAAGQTQRVSAADLLEQFSTEGTSERPCADVQFRVAPGGTLEDYGDLEAGCSRSGANSTSE